MVPIWYPKDRARAASGDRADEKAVLHACGATNLPEHESRITHHGSGVRVPFGPASIKLGGCR